MRLSARCALALLLALAASGCSEYEVVQPEATPPVQRGEAPLPLTVGLAVVRQNLSGGYHDIWPDLSSRLDRAGLFQTVLHPMQFDAKPDLILEVEFEGRFEEDEGIGYKGFLTGVTLYVLAPMMGYEHHSKATATVRVMQGAAALKSYTADVDVLAKMPANAPFAGIQSEAAAAATSLLLDRLVSQMAQDRPFYAGVRKGQP